MSTIFAGQHDVALEYLEKANSEDDSIHQVHYGLALINLETGDKDTAALNISKACNLDPENPEYHRLQKDIESS